MFLSLLTADAAASHGHEFSSRPSSPERRSPIPRILTPLSVLSYGGRARTPPIPVPPSASTATFSKPSDANKSRGSIMSAESEHQDPDGTYTVQSRPTSSTSEASNQRDQRKRVSRSKTSYSFAHPPSNKDITQKLHLRSKLLLQLHQVFTSSRPKPAYEVFPSALLAVNLKRKYAQEFKGRDKLGIEDLVVVKAEDYRLAEGDEGCDEEGWATREVVGCICTPKKEDTRTQGKTEIILDDDIVWEATLLSNGGYEFNMTDSHGLNQKARWIPRTAATGRSPASHAGRDASSPVAQDKRFIFSIIEPSSRRHPVIASMTGTGLDIMDQYTVPLPFSSSNSPISPIPTPLSGRLEANSYMEAASTSDRLVETTSESLRKLIVVSGIWVALRENWSPAFRYSTNSPAVSPNQSPIKKLATRPWQAPRSTSMPIGFDSGSRSTTPDSAAHDSTTGRRSFARMLRSAGAMIHRPTGSTASTLSTSPPPASQGLRSRSRRAYSTDTASLRRTVSTQDRVRSACKARAKIELVVESQEDGSADEADMLEMTSLSAEGTSEPVSEVSATAAQAAQPPHTPSRAPKVEGSFDGNVDLRGFSKSDASVVEQDPVTDSSPETAGCYTCFRKKDTGDPSASANSTDAQEVGGIGRLFGLFKLSC